MNTETKEKIYKDVMNFWNDKKNRPVSQKEMLHMARFFYKMGERDTIEKAVDYLEDSSNLSEIEIEAFKNRMNDGI